MKLFKLIPNKYPLVLLPGTGCNHLLWEKMRPSLSPKYHHILPNLFSCASQDAMLERINAIEYKQFALLGFSMGGYLAQHFYARYPDRVSHLMLICTSGQEKFTSTTQIEKAVSHLTDEAHLAHMIDTSKNKKNKVLYAKLIEMLNQVGPDVVRRQMYATQKRVSVLEKLSSTHVPVLVVGAEQDKLVPKSHSLNLATALGTEVTWINSGHMLPLEAPNELANLLNTWLANQEKNYMVEAKP